MVYIYNVTTQIILCYTLLKPFNKYKIIENNISIINFKSIMKYTSYLWKHWGCQCQFNHTILIHVVVSLLLELIPKQSEHIYKVIFFKSKFQSLSNCLSSIMMISRVLMQHSMQPFRSLSAVEPRAIQFDNHL